jgi:plasmid stabilization system protein ParE
VDCKLIWTESAIADLGAIVRYVSSKDGPDVARQIGYGIYDRAQILKQFPEAGSLLPEKQDSRWRKLIFKSWKIAYRIDADAKIVYLARVWHASRDEVDMN